MADMMERASLWLDKTTKRAHGRKVTYRRGALSIPDLTVTPGQTEWDAFGTDAGASARTFDMVATVADLFLDSVAILPQRGDEIDYIDRHGKRHTFAVLPQGEAKPYRYTDTTELRVRIHTVKIAANQEVPQ